MKSSHPVVPKPVRLALTYKDIFQMCKNNAHVCVISNTISHKCGRNVQNVLRAIVVRFIAEQTSLF